MFDVFYSLVLIVWIFDIFNFKFMEILDTTYPINTVAWVIIFLVLGSIEDKRR